MIFSPLVDASSLDFFNDEIIFGMIRSNPRAWLIKEGFTDIYNLYGGLIYWLNQGYPVVDNSNQTTQNIHIYSQEWGKWLKKGKPIH